MPPSDTPAMPPSAPPPLLEPAAGSLGPALDGVCDVRAALVVGDAGAGLTVGSDDG
jgi:hypothetical protein